MESQGCELKGPSLERGQHKTAGREQGRHQPQNHLSSVTNVKVLATVFQCDLFALKLTACFH